MRTSCLTSSQPRRVISGRNKNVLLPQVKLWFTTYDTFHCWGLAKFGRKWSWMNREGSNLVVRSPDGRSSMQGDILTYYRLRMKERVITLGSYHRVLNFCVAIPVEIIHFPHSHLNTHTHTNTLPHTTHTNPHTHTHTHTPKHTQTYYHTPHTQTHTHTQTHYHTPHTQTHKHTTTHHTHKHTHTDTNVCFQVL